MNPEIAAITDRQTGARAELLVSLGFNCFRFTAMPGGRPIEAIYAPGDFTTGQARPSKGGIPLMLPFPGRIPGTTFTWEGKQYQLDPGDAFGNAIHGFVMWRKWRILEQADHHITGQFHAGRDDPALAQRWPADFSITATYTLDNNVLAGDYTIENPGETPLPCGFGTHPYFRLPLGGPAAEACIVRLPVSAQWELKDMLPTGQRMALSDAAQLQAGSRYGAMKYDDALSGLTFAGDWCTASLHDPASGVSVTQRFDRAFRECVVYTPPHREAICIEPLTCVPSCFDLSRQGIDAGLRILPPGGKFTARVEIAVTQQ